ncbi:hypothetical protein C0Q70_12869 [Pomacea canaliculata]|uniref:PiggyBac transposable element-derived protein domain-containing protein n=1 Tax=Pomacea canaliculata TaxID=400727 RepID=A0A2T7P2R4_POMCA|nr:hypothetical protein C0Q70_12869 [Pomacea canaliculata]
MELEVGDDDDDDDKDECLYVEENSSSEEDEEELNYGNRSADQYMTEVIDEDDEYDVEIDKDSEHCDSETPSLVEQNVPENVPSLEEGDLNHEWSNFHLNDDSAAVPKGQPGYDPLHKLRPFINHLNHLFQTTYIPEQHIIIDEALCPWRGKLSFKVYMKDKPVKWGIKLYHLCESKSGYVWQFEILCGMPGLSNRPYDVVQRLLGPLKSLGYCLYTDTYYTSLALAEDLASSNTGFTGTVLSNIIGLPKEFMNTKLDTGGVDFRRCKNTVVLRWKDKTDVAVLSTIHRPQMVAVNTRTSVKKRPTAIVDYHKNMGGVDLNDHMISYNAFYRKTTKWWKKLAFHMLTLTMVQAHCLYLKVRKMIGKPGMCLEDFMISVGEDLVTVPKSDGDQPTGAAVPQDPQQLRIQGSHLSHFLVPLKGRKNCCVCYARLKAEGTDSKYRRKRTKRTKWECQQCKKALCVHPCMKAYHTMQDYTRPLQNLV